MGCLRLHIENEPVLRMTYSKKLEKPLKKTVHYYPFGLKHKGYNYVISSNGNSTAQKKLYNGKELQDELGLNWHDYGARNYDASLGRWMNIDPLAEKYYDKSSYVYVFNNPIFFIDPDGREVDVTDLVNGGTDADRWLLVQLVLGLSNISGEDIGIHKNEKTGKATLISNGCKKDCKPSRSATGYVSHLLSSNSGIIEVKNNSRNKRINKKTGMPAKYGGSQAYSTGEVYLDANQIHSFEQSINEAGYNGETMNTGFVFLHESLHTISGASYYNSKEDQKEKEGGVFTDPKGGFSQATSAGNTVNRVNKFRKEMELPTRYSYTNWNGNKPGSLVLSVKGKRVEVSVKNRLIPKK